MNPMRIVGTLTLVLVLVVGLLGVGLSVCRSFMDLDCMAQMAGAGQDPDFCQKMCQLGQDESPALLEKAQPKLSPETVAIFVHQFTLPVQPVLHSIHEGSRLDVQNKNPIGEVYLLNASFLI
tara:strand:+ start:172 stop:537 length:366 start_codon:yes stop_codon:yes gene_type:complete